jgi:hypothetical protein
MTVRSYREAVTPASPGLLALASYPGFEEEHDYETLKEFFSDSSNSFRVDVCNDSVTQGRSLLRPTLG